MKLRDMDFASRARELTRELRKTDPAWDAQWVSYGPAPMEQKLVVNCHLKLHVPGSGRSWFVPQWMLELTAAEVAKHYAVEYAQRCMRESSE